MSTQGPCALARHCPVALGMNSPMDRQLEPEEEQLHKPPKINTYGYRQTHQHFILLWSHGILNLLSWHQILSLDPPSPFAILWSSGSGFSKPDTPSCYKPTLVSHFISLPPSLWSTQLLARPHLAQTTPTVFIQAILAGCKDTATQISS